MNGKSAPNLVLYIQQIVMKNGADCSHISGKRCCFHRSLIRLPSGHVYSPQALLAFELPWVQTKYRYQHLPSWHLSPVQPEAQRHFTIPLTEMHSHHSDTLLHSLLQKCSTHATDKSHESFICPQLHMIEQV